MAEQVAAGKTDAVASNTEGKEKPKDGNGEAYFTGFLHDYRPIEQPHTSDILDDRYTIDLGTPLPDLNTQTATAYHVTDGEDPPKDVYALVCFPEAVPRHDVIQTLSGHPHPNLLSPVAADVVHFLQTGESRFVIIHEKPFGQTLTDVVSKAGRLGEEFIVRNIIPPLANVIAHLARLNITHGRINPDNIYIREKVVIGECVSEPCGSTQPPLFEPLERIQAHPAGKGDGENQDYYALGAVVAYALYGAKHCSVLTKEHLTHYILREGTYHTITRGQRHPETFDDLLRGTLHDHPEDRWTWKQLQPWLNSKRFNVLPPPAPTANMRPYELNGKEAYTRRELAEMLFQDWVQIPTALRDNQFIHWITVNLKNKPLADNIQRTVDAMSKLTAKDQVQFNEQIMQLLIQIDPDGPVRMYPLSFFPSAISQLYLHFFKNKQQKELNLLIQFLEQNMILYWTNLNRKESTPNTPEEAPATDPIDAVLSTLEKMRVALRGKGPGFGAERILYELNPTLPCLSPLLEGAYIHDVKTLLQHLDQMAPKLINKNNAIDNHIFAYLASKLGIQHTIKLPELDNIPGMANNRDCIALRILSMAQYRCGNVKFPGLTHWMGLQVMPTFKKVKSRTIRRDIQKKIKESAASGYMQVMAKELIDGAHIDRDHSGYTRAYNRYQYNIKKIASLEKGEFLNRRSNYLGLKMAKNTAYILLGLTVLFLGKGY